MRMVNKKHFTDRMVARNITIPWYMNGDMYYYDQVNWSEVCRKAIQRKINQLNRER